MHGLNYRIVCTARSSFNIAQLADGGSIAWTVAPAMQGQQGSSCLPVWQQSQQDVRGISEGGRYQDPALQKVNPELQRHECLAAVAWVVCIENLLVHDEEEAGNAVWIQPLCIPAEAALRQQQTTSILRWDDTDCMQAYACHGKFSLPVVEASLTAGSLQQTEQCEQRLSPAHTILLSFQQELDLRKRTSPPMCEPAWLPDPCHACSCLLRSE